jgi:CRP-like cAMP-binding protein
MLVWRKITVSHKLTQLPHEENKFVCLDLCVGQGGESAMSTLVTATYKYKDAANSYKDAAKTNRGASLICETVFPEIVTKAYAPKQDIFSEGDGRRNVYMIESGAVCLYRVTAEGKRQIFDFAFNGDIIGLGTSSLYLHSAQAISRTALKSVPASKLHQLAACNPALALGLYQTLSSELDSMRDLLLAVGQCAALERLARFLLTISERNARNGKDPEILNVPMTRTDIADLLSMTIETASRMITKLRTSKVIELIAPATCRLSISTG